MKKKLIASIVLLVCFGVVLFAQGKTGKATGKAVGFGNVTVSVEVTMSDGKITDVKILDPAKTSAQPIPQHETAIKTAPDLIKKNNAAKFDVVAGATITCKAITEAAQKAINAIK